MELPSLSIGSSETEKRFVTTIAILSGLCIGLLVGRMLATGSLRYGFVPGNLALAWVSFILAWLLKQRLVNSLWSSWQNMLLTLLWLIFLPNSWYVITDLIHVPSSGQISQLYDVMLISCLVFSGFCLGLASLYIVHRELLKRLRPAQALMIIEAIILICSFAIYLGRELRWNTWDIVANPAGVLVSVTDRFINPLGHLNAINVTGLFFATISVIYLAFWSFMRPTKL